MNRERAAIEVEVCAQSIVHHREHLLSVLLVAVALMHWLLAGPLSAAIHEDVLLSRVPVEIAVELNLSALQRLAHHLFNSERLREQLGARVNILSVEIVARQAASVVAHHYTVRVQHWHDFEDVALAQYLRRLRIADEECYEALDYVRAVALARVHATSDDDALAFSDLILRAHEVRDDQHLEIVAGDCLTQRCSPQDGLALGWRADIVKVCEAIGVCVRVAHGHVHLILIVLQRELEAQRVERCRLLLVGAVPKTERLALRGGDSDPTVIVCLLAIYLARWLVVLIVRDVVAGAIPSNIV